MPQTLPRLTFLLATTLSVLALPSYAADTAETALRIHAPYVRLAPPGAAATGAFMRIENAGATDRQLIKAESPAAKTVELHTHLNEGGMMKMRAVPFIAIKAGGQTELKPGSYHVMLIGMQQPLKDGDTVSLTLSFDDGSRQQIEAPVRKIQAEGMMHGGMKH